MDSQSNMDSHEQLIPDPHSPNSLDTEPDHLHADPAPHLETHLWQAELNPSIDSDHFHADIRPELKPDLPSPIHPRFQYELGRDNIIYNHSSIPDEGSGFTDPFHEFGLSDPYFDPDPESTLLPSDDNENKVNYCRILKSILKLISSKFGNLVAQAMFNAHKTNFSNPFIFELEN